MKTLISKSRSSWLGRMLVILGAVGTLSVAVASPAHASRSGTWESDVWYTRWTADSTYTIIEPHMFASAAAGICRYTGSGPTYYYGPYRNNNLATHNKSRVDASNGYNCGNFFRHQGINYWV